jgi:superfamily II DNA or RNA helicase
MGLLRRAIEETRLKAATRVSPFIPPVNQGIGLLKTPSAAESATLLSHEATVAEFSSQQFAFLAAKVAPLAIPPLFVPPVTDSLCFSSSLLAQPALDLCLPEITDSSVTLAATHEDLTSWLSTLTAIPPIHSISVHLRAGSPLGKVYLGKQTELPFGTDDGKCHHGLRKTWCGRCRDEATRPKTSLGIRTLDLFDLILPLLQPPPGEALNNRLWFLEGCDLFDFQRKGIKFLSEHAQALLADEMGLGKSIQAIVAARLFFRQGAIRSALVVCPKSLITDWEVKLWDWAPELQAIKIDGSQLFRRQVWRLNFPFKIVSYDTLSRDIDELEDKHFDLCILDEAQRIKNRETGVAKACKQLRADYRWALTGTPLEGKVEDVVSLFEFIKPGLLHPSDDWQPNRVREMIAPYVLRRRIREHASELKLLEKSYDIRWLELLPQQQAVYAETEQNGKRVLTERGEAATRVDVLALITKLKLICNYEPESKESCKLEFIKEQLEELSEQAPEEKALIFSQYTDKTISYLEQELAAWGPLVFTGSLSQRQRDQIRQQFQNDEVHKLLLMSVRAGGVGLTLHRASRVYHFDLWWNPATASQAEGRAYRIGQERPVFVTSFLVRGTIEERIHEILRQKQKLFDSVVDKLSDEDVESKLSDEELFGLFGLEPPKRTQTGAHLGERKLEAMTGREFEELVAGLFQGMGYAISLTRASKDGGVDIYARKQTDATQENIIIQCKQYPSRAVGVQEARALNGLLSEQFTQGVLVTSGYFSAECRDFCTGKRIRLINGAELSALLEKYWPNRAASG